MSQEKTCLVKKKKKKSRPDLRKSKEKNRIEKKEKKKRRRAITLPRRGGKNPQKKEKKKSNKAMLLAREKKKKRKLEKVHVHMQMVIFVNQKKVHPYSVFSPFWGENILVSPGRKYQGPTIYFPFFLLNQTHSKKVIIPIFSPKFSINPIPHLNKHTLRESGAQLEFIFYFLFFFGF